MHVYLASAGCWKYDMLRCLKPKRKHESVLGRSERKVQVDELLSEREREKDMGNTNYQENTAGYGCSKRFIHFPVWEELSEVCRIVHQELQSAYGTSWNRRTGIVVEETTKQMRIFQ